MSKNSGYRLRADKELLNNFKAVCSKRGIHMSVALRDFIHFCIIYDDSLDSFPNIENMLEFLASKKVD